MTPLEPRESPMGGADAHADSRLADALEFAFEALLASCQEPVSQAEIAAALAAHPHAAAVCIQLLRLLPHLSPGDGLTAESLAYAVLQGSAEHAAWLAAREPPAAPIGDGRVRMVREGDCLDIVLDRPEAGNAIDRAMRDALCEAFALARLDPEIARIRLLARGKAFCLGADLGEFGTTRDPASAHAIRMERLPAREIIGCMDKLEVRIDGACIGAGLEMAAFANRITATPRSWFQLPELAMGIIPGAGGCVSLTRRIGWQRAALLILSGKRLSARQALAWGLIDAIVD